MSAETQSPTVENVVAELRLAITRDQFCDGTTISHSTAGGLFALIERVERERDEAWGQAHLGHSRAEAAEARVTALEAEKAEKDAALAPLARLEIPKKPVGNAGAYSIRHDDIRRARQALSRSSTEAGDGQ